MGLVQGDVWADESAGFRAGTADERRAGSGLPPTEGLYEGTRVATQMGWRPVEAVVPGDRVLTFDAGLQPVRAVRRAVLTEGDGDPDCPPHHWPLAVPEDALGNRMTLQLAPEQLIVLESDRAEELYGDPFVLVPAAALEGWRGIAPVRPQAGAELLFLGFETPQIVHGIGAVLYHCPGGFGVDGTWLDEYLGAPSHAATALGFSQACDLVADLADRDEVAALCQAAFEAGANLP